MAGRHKYYCVNNICEGGIFMRKYYLDNIRWITVVLVVIYHVLYMYNAEGILGTLGNITGLKVQYYDMYQYFVYPWFMFLLFIVSGISSRLYLERHTDREFIKTRTTKLLVPCTIGLFAFHFIQGYINMSMGDGMIQTQTLPLIIRYLIMVVSGTSILWYIQVLWIFSMLLIPIRKLEKNRVWEMGSRVNLPVLLLLTIAVFGAAQILNTPIIAVYRFGYYSLAFLLGYFVFSHEEVIEVLKKYFPLFAVLAVALGVTFCAKYFGGNYADVPINRTPLFTTFGWFASLAFLGGGAKYLNFSNGFTSWMCKESWGLYIFHYLGISIVAVFLAKKHILPVGLIYLLSLIAAFVVPYILTRVIGRIPFLRWAVLGIKKEKGKERVQ